MTAPTPLDERMRMHRAGQITWPEPALGRTCAECRHFLVADVKTRGKGRCDLVRAHANGKVTGVLFEGANAIACPQFAAGNHQLNAEAKRNPALEAHQ